MFPFSEWNPDMSSESCSETQLKTTDLEYTENYTQWRHWLRYEKLWRCGDHYQDFSVTLPTQRQHHTNMIISLLFQGGLGCAFYRLPSAFHPVYKCHVPRAISSSTAPREEKTQLGFKRSRELPWLCSKKSTGRVGWEKKLSALKVPAIKSFC